MARTLKAVEMQGRRDFAMKVGAEARAERNYSSKELTRWQIGYLCALAAATIQPIQDCLQKIGEAPIKPMRMQARRRRVLTHWIDWRYAHRRTQFIYIRRSQYRKEMEKALDN